MAAGTILGFGGEEDEVTASLAVRRTAFEALPDEIIEQILCLTDPSSFASLVLLNRKWRIVSQQAHLYAHHLSRCPSYAATHHSIPFPDSLPRLRTLFAREVKRNLFEAYLRPTETIINLVSTSIGASSAPGGEAFHFSLSPQGKYVLAYSSSRIHIIDVTGPDILVRRELKILRRPALTTISDDGSTLAVLSTDLQIDLYDLTKEHPKHSRAVVLDYTPRTIALSPTGSVLAAAYDSGVEVSSLDPGCTSADKRAVKCYAVDSLSFSRDGTQLLGTTLQSSNPSTVVLSAPYYNPGSLLPEESVSALWTTSILFPNGSRDCSHAVLLPSFSDDEATWTFTYDRVFETFRAVRIDDLRNGTTYFTGPTADSTTKLLPSTLPAASASGELVAAGFQGSIWVYGIPEDLDAVPMISFGTNSNHESEVSTPTSQLGHKNSTHSNRSVNRSHEVRSRTPQWQLLCDKFRNTFVEGRRMCSLDGVTAMNWVTGRSQAFCEERLVAVAPGVGAQPTMNESEGMSPVDGGRITILDFRYAATNGRKTTVTIEVGANEPEILEEEHRDLDTEVALVRRRTVAQRRGFSSSVSRSATTLGLTTQPETLSISATLDPTDPFTTPRPVGRRPSPQATSTAQTEVASIEEQDAFDAPYSHTSPRSAPTLRRAATAAAVNRRLHPRAVAQEHIEYRRADGREEHPHESDADNWVPPPPPYSKDPVPRLPEHIQRSILAERARANIGFAGNQGEPSLDFLGLDSGVLSRSHTLASSSTGESRRESYPPLRTLSHSTTRSSGGISVEEETPRPVTSPTTSGFDDLYDVSPPGTPQLAPQRPQAIQISRRPVSLAFTGGPSTTIPSPSLAMRATLQQPTSPIPQPMNGPLEDRLMEWESRQITNQSSESHHASLSRDDTPTPSSVVLTRERLDQDVPQRPNEDHRLTDLPPQTPEIQHQRELIESLPQGPPRRSDTAPPPGSTTYLPRREVPGLLGRRSDTSPVTSALPPMSPVSPLSPSFTMPSSDQIIRLNNRQSRPPSHILTDPSRRNSSTSLLNRKSYAGHSSTASSSAYQETASHHLNEQNYYSTTPRGAIGAHGSAPSRSRTSYFNSHNPHNLPSRPLSFGHSRLGSHSNPNLRPSLQRLDTIHSMGSNSEATAFFGQKPMMLGRQPSKAQRSASKNMQDAKRKGWRASMRMNKEKEKSRMGDGASSVGWTDVSRASRRSRNSAAGEKRNGGKCVVM